MTSAHTERPRRELDGVRRGRGSGLVGARVGWVAESRFVQPTLIVIGRLPLRGHECIR